MNLSLFFCFGSAVFFLRKTAWSSYDLFEGASVMHQYDNFWTGPHGCSNPSPFDLPRTPLKCLFPAVSFFLQNSGAEHGSSEEIHLPGALIFFHKLSLRYSVGGLSPNAPSTVTKPGKTVQG